MKSRNCITLAKKGMKPRKAIAGGADAQRGICEGARQADGLVSIAELRLMLRPPASSPPLDHPPPEALGEAICALLGVDIDALRAARQQRCATPQHRPARLPRSFYQCLTQPARISGADAPRRRGSCGHAERLIWIGPALGWLGWSPPVVIGRWSHAAG